MKKKTIAIALSAIMLLAVVQLFSVNVAGEQFFCIYEAEDVATSALTKAEFEGASNGSVVYGAVAPTEAALSFTVTAPAAGSYSVWVRAYVKSNYQCTLAYCDGSVLAGKVFLFKGLAVGAPGQYVWFQLDAREGGSAATVPLNTKTVDLAAGDNLFELRVRTLPNYIDDKLVNDGVTKTTHYFDCIIVTDNADYDPEKDWKKPEVSATTTGGGEEEKPPVVEKIDYQKTFEAEDAIINGMKTMYFPGNSGTGVIYDDSADQSNGFSVNITDIPKDGDYYVWIRIWTKSTHQCTFKYGFDSLCSGNTCRLANAVAVGGSYIWVRADVRESANSAQLSDGKFAMTEGVNTITLGVYTLCNINDFYLTAVNGKNTQSTHYIDCLCVTGDPEYNPNNAVSAND